MEDTTILEACFLKESTKTGRKMVLESCIITTGALAMKGNLKMDCRMGMVWLILNKPV